MSNYTKVIAALVLGGMCAGCGVKNFPWPLKPEEKAAAAGTATVKSGSSVPSAESRGLRPADLAKYIEELTNGCARERVIMMSIPIINPNIMDS